MSRRFFFYILNLIFLSLFFKADFSYAESWPINDVLAKRGFIELPVISPSVYQAKHLVSKKENTQFHLERYCQDLEKKFKEYGWKDKPCEGVNWQYELNSTQKRPLIYARFGSGKRVTLILSSVHPDEITPIPIGFRFAKYLQNNPHIYEQEDAQVIIAPLVNPDGFLRDKPTRTNANNVDLNRNFFTEDWYAKAHNAWAKVKSRANRYFPGHFPNSEIETIFQIKLIDDFHPDKILSIHAPLGFLDYDGPGDQRTKIINKGEHQAKQLVQAVSKKINNYRIVDYSFFPGSLGNYAGQERKIPTITVELQTIDAVKHLALWEQFMPGIKQSIVFPFKSNEFAEDLLIPRFSHIYN